MSFQYLLNTPLLLPCSRVLENVLKKDNAAGKAIQKQITEDNAGQKFQNVILYFTRTNRLEFRSNTTKHLQDMWWYFASPPQYSLPNSIHHASWNVQDFQYFSVLLIANHD